MTGNPISDTKNLADLELRLTRARWFMGKDREILEIQVVDQIVFAKMALHLVQVTYRRGAAELYSFWDGAFDTEFLKTLLSGCPLRESNGSLVLVIKTVNIDSLSLSSLVPIGVEQSNSSWIIPGQGFLKLYRKLEEGVHPEAEMGLFLAQNQRFPNTPGVVATWEYQAGERRFALGILHQCIPQARNAWSLLCEVAPDRERGVALASLLGLRTAQLHIALGRDHGNARFSPRPFAMPDLQFILKKIQFDLDQALQPALPAKDYTSDFGMKIRIHGDFHLGQVLWNGNDFMVIDFEGEPMRPLAERCQRHSPLKDVAGMLRSFSYVAEHLILGASPHSPEELRTWSADISQAFLQAYLRAMVDSALLPSSDQAIQDLLQVFLVEKALYELRYEQKNRPDWVQVPLRGLEMLLRQ